jgi:pimeloyl-ACP methyl ester carboxylesterase
MHRDVQMSEGFTRGSRRRNGWLQRIARVGAILVASSSLFTTTASVAGGDAIVITGARIGCLDIQRSDNMTSLVAQACNGKYHCSYKAPDEADYKRRGVQAATRAFCTQGMEVKYKCGDGGGVKSVSVPGDAWKHGPAELDCTPIPHGTGVDVDRADIGCLDMDQGGNLTAVVQRACNGKPVCDYKAPDEDTYKRLGVSARTRTLCTQGMRITYHCDKGQEKYSVDVSGDAWKNPPAKLDCTPVPSGPGISVIRADIGCLDLDQNGNLTRIVQKACNARGSCSYQAPDENTYRRMGVSAKTRNLCTQAMRIRYLCTGDTDPNEAFVEGDAWKHGPAELRCGVVATQQTVEKLGNESCDKEWPSKYVLTPPDMLDWTPTSAKGYTNLETSSVNRDPPAPATRNMYNTTPSGRKGAPASTIGANEGRLVEYLRHVAVRRDPMQALCESAKAFANDRTNQRPVSPAYGKALADLAVTGRHAYESFAKLVPTVDSLSRACAGVGKPQLTQALDRAYAVANAVRVDADGVQPSSERRALGWIAVSGEDDKPRRPVNVPTAPYPQFNVDVDASGLGNGLGKINTRYLIAHANPPKFPRGPARGSGAHQLKGELGPAFAADAQVILFIHGMDSRAEEALALTEQLHRLKGQGNWTIVALDLPTSGYTDSIDHEKAFGSVDNIGCHRTPMVDFIENFIVRFVDAADRQAGGALKPKIRTIIGGSLGGNMSLRLGRRNYLPGAKNESWIRTVIPWSPAAVWKPQTNRPGVMAGCDNGWNAKYDIARTGLNYAKDPEEPGSRRSFFFGAFNYAPPSSRPQAEYWWRDGWECKESSTTGSRIDRHETYDSLFRRWHWRLGIEQLVFSHRQNQGRDETRKEGADPLYRYNRAPMLFLAAEKDVGGDLGAEAHTMSRLMFTTPGSFRWLLNTGHSIHDERPAWFSSEIVKFLKAH